MDEKEKNAMISAMKKDKEGGGQKFWSLPSKFEGTKKIRIMPPLKPKGENVFYFKHKVHWINGRPYEDLEQTVYNSKGELIHEAQKDPINTYVQKLYRNSERGSDEWNIASQIRSKERYISRIIVRNPEDPSTELQPVFYEYGPTIFNILFNIITETEFGNIVDPKNGRDFNLTKIGTGRQSKYETSTPSPDTSPIFSDKEKLQKVFENAMKMEYTDLFEFVSPEEKQEALNEFLGIETKPTMSVPSNAPVGGSSNANSQAQNTSSQESSVDSSSDVFDSSSETTEEEDDIDSILNEFTD